jgi:hypothetical protein
VIHQSTRHIMLIEPLDFFGNPETMETNVYQVEEPESHAAIQKRALAEFRAFRDMLTENGVFVTVARGHKNCPDQIFPNWISTHQGHGAAKGDMILYPMLNLSRRHERAPEMISLLEKTYHVSHDIRSWEDDGLIIESTGSLCMDRQNRIVYAGLSRRTTEDAVRKWAAMMDCRPVIFETVSHMGLPVYHTDLVTYIGTTLSVVCAECIVDQYRDEVVSSLGNHREVMLLTAKQQQHFCGNSLEVLGDNDERMLVMSESAFLALDPAQRDTLGRHFTRLLHSPLPTIEKYGGGSARCLMLELF